jgi:hypothetical protein
MNSNTLAYLIVTTIALIFCGFLLFFTHDQGTHDAAIVMAGLALGHWFGYSNQLVSPSTPAPIPATAPVTAQEHQNS